MIWDDVLYLIIDDFYDDPDMVRNYALSQVFEDTEGYPGMRTEATGGNHNLPVKNVFEKLFNKKMNYWGERGFGGFQLNSVEDNPWVHTDDQHGVVYSALVYLNKEYPDYDCGTDFYIHKKSGKKGEFGIDYSNNIYADIQNTEACLQNYDTAWVKYDSVKYKYNRMVIFNAKFFHRTSNYFGDKHDKGKMRLMQVFFLTF